MRADSEQHANSKLNDAQRLTEPIAVLPFSGDQAAMDEIAAFHLSVRQWEVETAGQVFTNFFESQVDLPHIDTYYLRDSGNFFVARTAKTNRLVGIVGFRDDGDGQGVLKRLAVDPACHGEGIGTQLVDALVLWAREHSFRKVTLTTGENEKAKGIYVKVGFEEVCRVLRNRDYMMELDLTKLHN